MWYEMIPTLVAYSTFMIIPIYLPYFTNWAVRGKPFRRSAMEGEDRKLTMRDERLTGSAYKLLGLDNIPDPE